MAAVRNKSRISDTVLNLLFVAFGRDPRSRLMNRNPHHSTLRYMLLYVLVIRSIGCF